MAGAASGVYAIFALNIIYMVEHYFYLEEDRQGIFCNFLWITLSTFILFTLDDNIDSFAVPIAFLLGLLISV